VWHQAELAVPCKIRAGVARLAPTSLREGSRKLRLSHHLPNDFMKSNESAFILARYQHLSQGNRLTKAKMRLARVLLPHAPPLIVNPLTATNEGPGSSSNLPNPSSRRPSSTTHCQRLCWMVLVKTTRSPAPLFIATPGQGVTVGLDRPKPSSQH
jgi:hypothetical protein